MSLPVFAAVLAAAFMHAAWNALVKLRLEPILTMALITASAGVIALPALALTGLPPVAAWPWLLGSILLHLGYYIALTDAYRHADMGQVYPIARGSAPLLTTIVTVAVLREPVAPQAIAGIGILCGGIALMAFSRGRAGGPQPRALASAAVTAALISGYTLVDGIGARVAGSAHAYSAALFVVDGVPLLAFVLWRRGRAALAPMRAAAGPGLLGGLFSLGSYWIAIWAMTVAPIPLVAATRESSVLFATLIAVTVLKEPLLPARAAAALVIIAGIAAMRLT
ncbi:EamA family transporter [Methylobacterium sp. ID0610]|uniref:EamA family transporter n=1 Tax=Methylobacterium carpenticola TaxID=3344827 RepID=UPI00367E058B